MAASVDGLRQLVDAALAAGAAVEDDPGAASRAVTLLDELAQQQVLLTGCAGLRGELKDVAQEVVAGLYCNAHLLFLCRAHKCLIIGSRALMLSKAAQAAPHGVYYAVLASIISGVVLSNWNLHGCTDYCCIQSCPKPCSVLSPLT